MMKWLNKRKLERVVERENNKRNLNNMSPLDFIGEKRIQQAYVANKIANSIYKEHKTEVRNGNLNCLDEYLSQNHQGTPHKQHYDSKAAEDLIKGELADESLKAVIGYSDWVLSRIVRSNDCSVPSLNEIDNVAIQNKYSINSKKIIKKTVEFMHSEKVLPLLGEIKNDEFCPEKSDLEQYKKHYRW